MKPQHLAIESQHRPTVLTLLSWFRVCLVLSLLQAAASATAAGLTIAGQLSNFDLRYPASQPDDLEIVLYGDGLGTNDVAGTWDTSSEGVEGLNWGLARTITQGERTADPGPAYALDCVVVRYVGLPRPSSVNRLVHFGVRMRPGTSVVHQEIWWSKGGQRVDTEPTCDPQLVWHSSPSGWLVSIVNPYPFQIHVYGCRFAPIAPGRPLPLLSQLTTDLDPETLVGTNFLSVALPDGVRVLTLQAWCRLQVPIRVPRGYSAIFQIAARNVPEALLPLPAQTDGPDPEDFVPNAFPLLPPAISRGAGTMAILTSRPTEELAEDITGDGAVGIPDFNLLRSRFGARSRDANQSN